jgi:signal peptidase I
MVFRWFRSRSFRQAADLGRRVRKLLNAQRDILSPTAIDAISASLTELKAALRSGADAQVLQARAKDVEEAANKFLKPYPYSGVRENIDVILVALVVALGIRTFFLQPMAIPTGSMQPTLYGITVENLQTQPGARIPGVLGRWFDSLFRGISYYHVVAEADGPVQQIEAPRQVIPFVKKQRFQAGGHWYNIWFPPGTLPAREGVPAEQLLFLHAGVQANRVYRKGEPIISLRARSGDRLFVDRFTYNFRRPRVGEIVIFESRGIPLLLQDTHYIKRLVAREGDAVRIGNDRHLILNGERLDASRPHFEHLYTFTGPPREDHYSGHVNEFVGRLNGRPGIAPLLPDENAAFTVPSRHYLVMGDNTMNSYDSRAWGPFPQEKVVGKHSFVFWPISSRFGWAVR